MQFTIDVQLFLNYALIMLRINGMLFTLPFFGDKAFPLMSRLLLGVALSFGLYQIVPKEFFIINQLETFMIAIILVKELLIGMAVGFVAKIMFEGIIMAANLVGYQMGFGTGSLFMPDSEEQLTPFTAFHRIIVISFFLTLNLHFTFINGIIESFSILSASDGIEFATFTNRAIMESSRMLSVGFQLASPVLVSLLFSMSALGLVARAVPQINVFVLNFPISFFVGIFTYFVMLYFLPAWLRSYYMHHVSELQEIFSMLKP